MKNFSFDPVTSLQQRASGENLASNYLSAQTCTFFLRVFLRDCMCFGGCRVGGRLRNGVFAVLTTSWLLALGPWRQCQGEVNQTISPCKSLPRDPRASHYPHLLSHLLQNILLEGVHWPLYPSSLTPAHQQGASWGEERCDQAALSLTSSALQIWLPSLSRWRTV